MRLVPDLLAVVAVKPRNRECLWRLASLAERRKPEPPGSS